MGKKKASRGRKLRPLLEKAIKGGAVFVREQRQALKYNMLTLERVVSGRGDQHTYEVCIGADLGWVDVFPDFFIPIMVYVSANGRVEWSFVRREHVLGRADAEWLSNELLGIVTMAKLGGYSSAIKAVGYSEESASFIYNIKRQQHLKIIGKR
jgi:hypothetical protein